MNKKILLVEDEPDMRLALELTLKPHGYEVLAASNGHEALGLIKKTLPDLIIADVLMPVMDGFTFYKELKKQKATSSIPVIILTARGKMEDTFKVIGADEFITKPFEGDKLLSKIEKLLHRKVHVAAPLKKALVCGSSKDLVGEMVLLLRDENFETDHCSDGPMLITKIVQNLPDVIIMDVHMEGMTAEETIKVVRQLPRADKIPLFIYSFYATAQLEDHHVRKMVLDIDLQKKLCLEAGANHYLGRYNELTFVEKILKLLEKK